MEDQRIVELFWERSEEAIDHLSRKYGVTLLRFSRRMLNNDADAEECVNDTYLAVWNAIPPSRPQHLLSFVCRVARNLCLKRRRFQSAAKRNSRYDVAFDELSEVLFEERSLSDELEAQELSADLNEFLESLAPCDRVMFVKRYWFSESIEELALAFGMTRHHVSVRLSRLREKLKRFLTEKGVYL